MRKPGRGQKKEHSGYVVMHIEETIEAARVREIKLKQVGYQTKIVERKSQRFQDGLFITRKEFRVMAEWVRVL